MRLVGRRGGEGGGRPDKGVRRSSWAEGYRDREEIGNARRLRGREMRPSYIYIYIYAYNRLRGRNETTGRKRQSTTASMRKPRRNDTRTGANWALEVTPSRGMLFHPRSVPQTRLPPPPSGRPPDLPASATSFCLLVLFLPTLHANRRGRRGSRKPSYHREHEVKWV